MTARELLSHVLQIGHAGDVEPAFGHGHHHIGMAKPERGQKVHRTADIGEGLTHQILAGNAEMHAAGLEPVHDLSGGGVFHLHAGEAFELAAIAALMAFDAQGHAAPLKQRGCLLLEAPL